MRGKALQNEGPIRHGERTKARVEKRRNRDGIDRSRKPRKNSPAEVGGMLSRARSISQDNFQIVQSLPVITRELTTSHRKMAIVSPRGQRPARRATFNVISPIAARGVAHAVKRLKTSHLAGWPAPCNQPFTTANAITFGERPITLETDPVESTTPTRTDAAESYKNRDFLIRTTSPGSLRTSLVSSTIPPVPRLAPRVALMLVVVAQ